MWWVGVLLPGRVRCFTSAATRQPRAHLPSPQLHTPTRLFPARSTGLRTAAEDLVDRELAVIRAATGLTDERVSAVAARNQQLLAALGFGQGTLAADLMDDDEDDDELMPSPAAGGGGERAGFSLGLHALAWVGCVSCAWSRHCCALLYAKQLQPCDPAACSAPLPSAFTMQHGRARSRRRHRHRGPPSRATRQQLAAPTCSRCSTPPREYLG